MQDRITAGGGSRYACHKGTYTMLKIYHVMFVGNHIADINIIVETHTEGLSTVIRINDMIY